MDLHPETMNPGFLETERLILRPFTDDDLEAIYRIFGDKELNIFLPWFPLQSMDEAKIFYLDRLAETDGIRLAICLEADNIPIGYVNVAEKEPYDLGYGLLKEFRHQGIIAEACQAVQDFLRSRGLPYVTATHDVQNPKSGDVMKRLGMRYGYSYAELWQPKNVKVVFRLYQLNLDGKPEPIYRGYWDQSDIRFIEEIL